jgi:DNA-binding transcriptional ArsR family regulator
MQAKSKNAMSDAQLEEAARLFGVLSEPSRLRLLRVLMVSPMTVGELVEATGLKQGNVSKHLALLLQHDFVSRVAEGNFARYHLADKSLDDLCRLMCARISEQFRAKAKMLA